jgi:cell division protein FtsW
MTAITMGARTSAKARARATARPSTYVLLIATVTVLNVVGVVMVLSASSVVSLESKGSAWYYFQRQLIWVLLGAVGFAIALRIDYRRWRTVVMPLVALSATTLVLVLVPHVGVQAGESRRWLGIGAWGFQPSEIAKLAMVLYAADVLARRRNDVWDWRRGLRPVLVVVGAFVVLICLEPDFDSAVLLAVIVGVVLILGGARLYHLAVVSGIGLAAITVFALSADYRRTRLLSFLHPMDDVANTGYQAAQSLTHLANGGIAGVGLGAGRGKWLYLPNPHTDFIFAVIGEEVGLIGTLLVLGLFAAFAVLGVRTALRAPDRFGMLLAAGITVWIVVQAVVNMGGVIGLLPVSSVPLPFVSFGGSSLLITMVGAGLLTNIARRAG